MTENKKTRFVNTDLLASEPTPQAPIKRTDGRVYGTQTQKIHDLYKLRVEAMKKNIAQDQQIPVWVPAEHCHFFHTFTSDGVEQNTSSTIGGHFHVMEIVTPATEDTPAVYKCSPAMKWAMVKGKYGQKTRQMVIANPEDTHTHEIEYLRSEKMELRKKNFEAAAFHAQQMAKFDKTVPGVQ